VPWVATNNVPDHDVNKAIEPTRVHALVRLALICLHRSGQTSPRELGETGGGTGGAAKKSVCGGKFFSRGLSIFMDRLYAKILITTPNAT